MSTRTALRKASRTARIKDAKDQENLNTMRQEISNLQETLMSSLKKHVSNITLYMLFVILAQKIIPKGVTLYKRHLKERCPKRSNTAEKSCSSPVSKIATAEFLAYEHEMKQDQDETLPNLDFGHIIKCEVCSLTFSKSEDLEKHIKEHHSGSRGKITFSLY